MADSAITELPKAPNMIRQKGHSIEGLSTQNHLSLLLPTTVIEGEGSPEAKASSQARKIAKAQGAEHSLTTDLLWAEIIPGTERGAARQLLSQAAPSIRQVLLDEWVGQRRNPAKQMPNPLAYLAGIVRAARNNAFVPTLALQVAAARQKQAEIAAARAAVLERPLEGPSVVELHPCGRRPAARAALPEHVNEQLNDFKRRLRCRR